MKFGYAVCNFFMAGMYWIFFICRQGGKSLPDLPFRFHSAEGELAVYICSEDFDAFKGRRMRELVAKGITRDHLGQSIRKRRGS
jgi:hypothetical protein